MKIRSTDTFVILEDEKDDIKDFASYLEFIIPKAYKGQNIIVNLLKYSNMSLQDLLLFLKISTSHRKTKQSFILVNNDLDIDIVPPEIMVVPTLQEGEDVVEMEEIERDLGF
ncbi:MAG: ribonuclease Z [Patiriisocius sp.]|uniref:ribonuclease Z n=1 Tax=Patiriisocius sp. TaxID=2822396 RepID=UPI003EF40E7A